MALTREGTSLTDKHRRVQLGLRAATVRDIIRLMPMWKPDDPASYERFAELVIVLTQSRAKDSAVVAARYYQMFSDVELPGGRFLTAGQAAAIVEPPSPKQLRASIDATAKPAFWRAMQAGYRKDEAVKQAAAALSGSMGRYTLNGGRETILESVRREPRWHGWARVTDGDPCPFCAMLAGRGPVYREESVGFRAHDHCTCGIQPVASADDWPGKAREYEGFYHEAKAANAGSGEEFMTTYRREYRKRYMGAEG